MVFTNSLPITTTATATSPDGKWTASASSTTSTIVSISFASPDGITVASDSGVSFFDSLNTWSVVKGVIQYNGAPMVGTNNVTKMVWSKGVVYQTNGTLWWTWDAINQIWAAGSAPVL